MSNGLDVGRNFEAAKIGAAKNVTRIRRRGNQPNMDGNGGVQSYAVSFDWRAERSLFDQKSGALSL